MLLIDGKNSLHELLGSAETPEDLAAMEELIAERESQRAKASRWTVKTLAEVAEVFGVAAQTAKQWRMESPPMPGEPGAWPIPEIIKWKFAKVNGGDLNTARKEQDLELGRVQLERQKIELAKERGELLPAADVELWAATACVEFREQIMQLPEVLSASMPPANRDFVRDESDRHCRAALTALRRRLESDPVESVQPVGTATEDEVG